MFKKTIAAALFSTTIALAPSANALIYAEYKAQVANAALNGQLTGDQINGYTGMFNALEGLSNGTLSQVDAATLLEQSNPQLANELQNSAQTLFQINGVKVVDSLLDDL